jgi:hypothetical protein
MLVKVEFTVNVDPDALSEELETGPVNEELLGLLLIENIFDETLEWLDRTGCLTQPN